MRARKRGADDPIRFSKVKKTTFIDRDDGCRDVLSYLGEEVASIRKSVVLLILSNGTGQLSTSSGIPIERQSHFTRFLTTAALIKPLYHKIEDPDNLKIEVHHEAGTVLTGLLEEYDLDLNIAVVKVMIGLDVCCILLNREMELPCHEKAVAVWRDVCGIKFTEFTKDGESFLEDLQERVLFYFNGNFVGMNRGPCLLSGCRVFELLKVVRDKERVQGGMILIDTFEEPFGDTYPKGVWTAFGETSSRIVQSVVALDSFKDFDENCTTVLTSAILVRHPYHPKEIVEGLKIKVLLPSKQHMEGTLRHYSLRYNVALISVKNVRALHTMNLDCKTAKTLLTASETGNTTTLVAVGRCFESGVVMAASGMEELYLKLKGCSLLNCSSCKITKAGIGGPLVDLDGNFFGMNFYDQDIGTPYMLREYICGVLKYFKTKEIEYHEGEDFLRIVPDDDGEPVRWDAVEPDWYHPDDLKKDWTPENERRILDSGRPYRYIFAYIDGKPIFSHLK